MSTDFWIPDKELNYGITVIGSIVSLTLFGYWIYKMYMSPWIIQQQARKQAALSLSAIQLSISNANESIASINNKSINKSNSNENKISAEKKINTNNSLTSLGIYIIYSIYIFI